MSPPPPTPTSPPLAVPEAQLVANCEQQYERELPRGHCHCLSPERDDVAGSLNAALASQRPRTMSSSRRGGPGGLAVVLRGGAFRGSRDDNATVRHAAQLQCSRAIVRHIVRPYERLGVRVRIFLNVYDDCDDDKLSNLQAPYETHVAAVTKLAANASEQLTAAANVLTAFLEHCTAHGDSFDAVVLTRFDLHFKQPFPHLLGEDLTELRGVRFLWRELEAGSGWRTLWNMTGAMLARLSEHDRKEALRAANRLAKARGAIMHPRSWLRSVRTSDTFHAFSFGYTRCFRSAILYEMTRNWQPIAAEPAMVEPPNASATTPSRNTKAKAPGPTLPHLVTNHWMHKVRYSVQRALPPSHLKFIVDRGPFDSNPCQGQCMSNPVYDILPRASWLVESHVCQDPERDFVYDNVSGTLCCPSPDYCCPNSVSDCTSANAVLFDASRVPTAAIEQGWRRHYLARMPQRFKLPPGWKSPDYLRRFAAENLTRSVCPITAWPDATNAPEVVKHSGCMSFTMDNASVVKVRSALRDAPPWDALTWPENDDGVHMISHSMRGPEGGPYAIVRRAYRDGSTRVAPALGYV